MFFRDLKKLLKLNDEYLKEGKIFKKDLKEGNCRNKKRKNIFWDIFDGEGKNR